MVLLPVMHGHTLYTMIGFLQIMIIYTKTTFGREKWSTPTIFCTSECVCIHIFKYTPLS